MMDIEFWSFWLLIVPIGVILWVGVGGWLLYLSRQLIDYTAERIGEAFRKGKEK